MNLVDRTIVLWLNQFAGVSGTFDGFVKDISDNYLIQAVVPITVLWAFWFARAGRAGRMRNRALVLATHLGAIAGVAAARAFALMFPFRDRPLDARGLGFHVLDPRWNADIHQWSSFPSDHAVLFFALATGITLLHRKIGIAMLGYAAVVDCLPRIYLGLHYPSDILAGALLGAASVLLVAHSRLGEIAAKRILGWAEIRPEWVYAGLFLCSFELATMFDSAIQIAQIGTRLTLAAARHASFVHAAPRFADVGAIADALVSVLLVIGILAVARPGRRSGHSMRGPIRRELELTDAPGVNPSHDEPVPLAPGEGACTDPTHPWLSANLLEFTHDAIIIWEMDGDGILYWNQAAEQLYGYSRHEARGKLTHRLLRTRIAAGGGGPELELALARFGVWVGELRHRSRDGRTIEVDARLALMSQRNGRWLVLEVNRDISDQRSAELQRKQATVQLAALRDSMPW